MTRPRYPRSTCCVPFCRRTSTLFKNEWVCGEHWRAVDGAMKRFRTRRLREIRRLVEKYDALTAAAQHAHFVEGTGPEIDIWRWANKGADARARWERVERAVWARMKRQAIERAGGIFA